MEADAKMNEKFGKDMSLINLEKMLRKTYLLVNESQNRNPSMKQINIFTLNYDQIVEKTLSIMAQLSRQKFDIFIMN